MFRCKHYSESGELLVTTLAVLECLQREGFVTAEEPARRRSAPAAYARVTPSENAPVPFLLALGGVHARARLSDAIREGRHR